MAQPQVPNTCSFEKTLEAEDVASKKISTFPTHIFEESAIKGFLTGFYILPTFLPRVSGQKIGNFKIGFTQFLKGYFSKLEELLEIH